MSRPFDIRSLAGRRTARAVPVALLLVLAPLGFVACAPEVGDACVNSVECDRGQVCDTAAPDGYCTRYDCLDNACPSESVCVDFTVLSACMRKCSSNGDCRKDEGYVCRKDLGDRGFCYMPKTD